jgi:ATP-dependent helicase/nuclease subunit A
MNEIALDSPTDEQQRASDPNASIWVAASAGSGKTKVLVDRVLGLLLGGTVPSRILCLTFTKAAATEMAIRVNATLGLWATSADDVLASAIAVLTGRQPDADKIAHARRLLAYVLDAPGGLKILTIHSFCESLLARFPLEAGIAPHFEVMDERSAAELLAVARDRVLIAARNNGGARSHIADALANITEHIREDQFAELMQVLANERGRLKQLLSKPGGIDAAIDAIFRQLGADMSVDERTLLAAASDDAAFDRSGLKNAALALAQGSEKSDQPRGKTIDNWIDSDQQQRLETFDDYATCYLTKELQPRARLISKSASAAAPAADSILAEESERLVQFMERRRAQITSHASASLLRLGEALIDAYEAEKATTARLDYDDLILTARRLLELPGIAPWVLYKLDGGLDHILIDEAQDTNPEQWAVIAALAGDFFSGEGAHRESRTIFAVGDVKQSIYSFQRADPAAFRRMREYFSSRVIGAKAEWFDVNLELSFRSTEAVLRAVDAVFNDEIAADGVLEDGLKMQHFAARSGHAGRVEVWPLAVPKETEDDEPWTLPVEHRPQDSPRSRLANSIAQRIREWIGTEVLESRNRPVRAGDIVVLVRRRGAFVEELVRALKGAEVPVSGVDRMVLTEQLAAMDLMALGRFLLLPEDDLTLATVLKGPFIGFDDNDLFQLAWDRGRDSLWQRLSQLATDDSRFAKARNWLAGLLARVDFTPPYELFAHVLVTPAAGERSGRASLLARLGSDAGDAIDEFLNLTVAYERAHIPSLQGFLTWIEVGRAEVKRDLEQSGRDEVRVMTVHGAKGLEAPIVILPDTASTPVTHSPPILWHGEFPLWPPKRALEERICRMARATAHEVRDQEYRRLLYVAMSRAEDRLYVCGWHGIQKPAVDCWYNLIVRGVERLDGVVPFEFHEEEGEGWSGSGLRFDGQQNIPAAPDGRDRDATDDLVGLMPWMVSTPTAEPTPPRPLVPSRTESEPVVRSPLDGDDGARFQRGLLIHRLLETLPTLPAHQQRSSCQRYLARPLHGLEPAERDVIEDEVFAVLTDADLAPIFAEEGRAEVPIVGTVVGPEGPYVVSGQVDRLVVREQEILVVDYKSNRPALTHQQDVPELYWRQMASYRAILANIWPDRAIRCALLWTDGPHIMFLDEQRLDRLFPAS